MYCHIDKHATNLEHLGISDWLMSSTEDRDSLFDRGYFLFVTWHWLLKKKKHLRKDVRLIITFESLITPMMMNTWINQFFIIEGKSILFTVSYRLMINVLTKVCVTSPWEIWLRYNSFNYVWMWRGRESNLKVMYTAYVLDCRTDAAALSSPLPARP